MNNTTNEIYLSDENYIGKGLHRKCYKYPNQSDKCIKINYNKGAEEETNREIRYYHHLIKRHISWDILAKYYGPVQTNLGQGHVFELIQDADGSTSKSLEYYLRDAELTEQYYQPLIHALKQLKYALLKDNIITMTLKSKNVLFQLADNENTRLIIVDNIGNSTFIPIANYFNWAAKAKIERTWQRFLSSLREENANNKWIEALINQISV